MSDEDFQKKSEAFLAWFKAQPGTQFHPNLKVVDLRSGNAGRGIVATAPIEPDADLFTIPRDIVITKENSSLFKKHPIIFDLFSEVKGIEDENFDWLALVLTLMYEYFLDDASPWKPYIDVLPSDFQTLMFWTDNELEELQASAVRQKVGKADADLMFQTKLVPFLSQHQRIFFTGSHPKPRDEELLALAHRVSSVIMAYAFDLEAEDGDEEEDGWVEDKEGKTLGMVPMADMLNADAEFNSHLSHGEESLTMTSLRPINTGDEVLNYYGPLPNSDLLRRYGYTSIKHRAHDVVEINWSTILDAAKVELDLRDLELSEAVNQIGADELEESFILEHDPVEPDSTGVLPQPTNVPSSISEELMTQVKGLLKTLRNVNPQLNMGPSSQWRIIKRALSDRLAEYPTSIAEDEQLLGSATGRRRMAIEVRLGEKHLIQKAEALVDSKIDELSNGNDEGPKPKRQKVS